jgi:hypothetical protein
MVGPENGTFNSFGLSHGDITMNKLALDPKFKQSTYSSVFVLHPNPKSIYLLSAQEPSCQPCLHCRYSLRSGCWLR